MHCIDFFVILKFCVKQLTFFERTVVAASDFKNCTMVHCAAGDHKFNKGGIDLAILEYSAYARTAT